MKQRSIFSVIFLSTLSSVMLILTCSALFAQVPKYGDRHTQAADQKRLGITASASSRGLSQAAHIGESPFPTTTPTDTRFVVDYDNRTGLDTDCQFRSQGSLKFKVVVKRYLGELNNDGTLRDAQILINNGVVSEFATLQMPAYDVDYDTAPQPPYQPERDRVLFNGVPIGNLEGDGYLRGINDKWILNEFKVPISLVRFAQKGTTGDEPTGGENEIEILIDQANTETGEDIWCTAIDWASISFKALAPVFMIHGNNSDGEFFSQFEFTSAFEEKKVPFDNTITMETASIKDHGDILGALIPIKAREFGARHVHIIAHSKGGLDTRDFLARTLESNFGVLSLTTLATPHHGSVLAEYSVVARRGSFLGTLFFSDRTILTQIAHWSSIDDGRPELTVSFVNQFFNPDNERKLPRELTVDGETARVLYFSYGADANLNDSHNVFGQPTITSVLPDETRGSCGFLDHLACVTAYRVVGNVATVRLEPRVVAGVTLGYGVTEVPTPSFQFNDFLVSINSSKLAPLFIAQPDRKDNHATIANYDVGLSVLNLIKLTQPVR